MTRRKDPFRLVVEVPCPSCREKPGWIRDGKTTHGFVRCSACDHGWIRSTMTLEEVLEHIAHVQGDDEQGDAK